jgi:iron complex outermembrane receptor protein
MPTPIKASWSKFTPKVSLSYNWTPEVMTYALWSRGYRGGGFNGRPSTIGAAITPYNPETLDNYELGFKTQFLNDRVRLNGAFYLMKYKDMQQDLDVPAPGTSTGRENRTINASKADLKGIELDLTARITPHFTIGGNLGYLDAKYKDFFGDIYSTGTPVDATFLKIRRARSGPGSARLLRERGRPRHAHGQFRTAHDRRAPTDLPQQPEPANDAQYLLDASISYKINKTMISVFGKNIANADGWTIGYDVQHVWSYGAARPPRSWGVAVTQNF